MSSKVIDDPFIAHCYELLEPFGRVNARRMFGGYGIYHDGLMFGLVADDVLYLKVDPESKPIFLEEGLSPFMYDGKGKVIEMSYHRAPDTAMEDPDSMTEWAERAYAAAVRSKR